MKPIFKKLAGLFLLIVAYILAQYFLINLNLFKEDYILFNFSFFVLSSLFAVSILEELKFSQTLSFFTIGFVLPKLIFSDFDFYDLSYSFKYNIASLLYELIIFTIVVLGFFYSFQLKISKNTFSTNKSSINALVSSIIYFILSLLFVAIVMLIIKDYHKPYEINSSFFLPLIFLFSSGLEITLSEFRTQDNSLSEKQSIVSKLRDWLSIFIAFAVLYFNFFIQYDATTKTIYIPLAAFAAGFLIYLSIKLILSFKKFNDYIRVIGLLAIFLISFQLFYYWTFFSFFLAGFLLSIDKKTSGHRYFNEIIKTKAIKFLLCALFFLAGIYFTKFSYPTLILIGIIFLVGRYTISYIAELFSSKIFKSSDEETSFRAFEFSGIAAYAFYFIYFKITSSNLDLFYQDMIFSIIVANIFGGFFISKIYFSNSKNNFKSPHIDLEQKIISKNDENFAAEKIKISEPNFKDDAINKAIYALRFKIKDLEYIFDKKIISKRAEQSFELAYEVSEIILEKYSELEKNLLQENARASFLKKKTYEIKDEISSVFLAIVDSRKKIEKNIIEIEPILTEYFNEFEKNINRLPEIFVVDIEQELLQKKKTESRIYELWKLFVKAERFLGKILNKNFEPQRKIFFRDIARYNLLGLISIELLETVNLIGLERLETLKKIKDLYEKSNQYLNEILQLIDEEENSPALNQLLFEKLQLSKELLKNQIKTLNDDIVNTNENIKTRLKYAIQSPYNRFLESLKISGTIYYSKRKNKFSKIKRKTEKAIEKSKESIKNWVNHYIGAIGLAEKEAIIERLKCDIALNAGEPLLEALEEIDDKLKNVCESTEIIIKNFKKKFLNTNENFVEFIANLKEELLSNVIIKNLSELEEIAKSKKIANLAESFLNKISNIIEKQTDNLLIIETNKLPQSDKTPDYLPLKFISLKKAASPILTIKLLRELSDISELLINHLSFTIEEMRNFQTIAEYRLNSSYEEFASSDLISIMSAKENLFKSFEIFLERTQRLKNQIEKIERNLTLKVLEIIDESLKEIENKIEEEIDKDSLERKTFFTIKNIILSIKEFYVKAINFIAKWQKDLFSFFKTNANFYLLKKYISIEEKYVSDSYSSPELDENKLKNLPYIYRRLFDGTPLENVNIFAPNNESDKIVEEILSNFKSNKICSVLISGEPGSGKRTIINSIAGKLSNDFQIYRKHLDDSVASQEKLLAIISNAIKSNRILGLDDIKFLLNDKNAKRVIILEGIQKLFLKKIGGYEALNCFLYLVSQTNKNVVWICSINKKAFEFLNSNFDLSSRFYKVVNAEIFRSLNIKEVILNRHNATGFDLRFLPSERIQLKKFLKKKIDPVKEQAKLEKEYFEKLEEYSEGNIIAAMYYWLKSIEKVEKNIIYIAPLKRITLPAIRNLDLISTLTLALIVQQGWISVKDHSEVFNININQSREILLNLANLNLIFEDKFSSKANKFFINKFFYKAIEKELSEKNIL